jgi:hypothetical protein
MVTVSIIALNNREEDTKLIARHMSQAIGDDRERIEHVSTNLLLTTLYKNLRVRGKT